MGAVFSNFQFSIYKRSDSKNWQVQFRDNSGHLVQRGTGTTNKLEAYKRADDWLTNGFPTSEPTIRRTLSSVFSVETIFDTVRKAQLSVQEARKIVDILKNRGLVDVAVVDKGPGDVDFILFLKNFWDYDKSEYIQDKLAHGQRIGRSRAYDMTCRLNLHWVSAFAGKTLSKITKHELKAFSSTLASKGLSASSLNHIMNVGTIALRWAHESELITSNPAEGLCKFSGKSTKRGVLEPQEVADIFTQPWEDERSYVGNLVAATTGLRAGEILALSMEDIGKDRLFVRHSWSVKDKLKSTKTDETREVPLLAEVRTAILNLAGKNPWGPQGFIFYSTKQGQPMNIQRLLNPLIEAFIRMKAGTKSNQVGTEESQGKALAEWKARRLCFHSWRHFYSARMADLIEARKIMLATGHKTESVFVGYADHARAGDFAEVRQATKDAFSKVLAIPESQYSQAS